MTTRPVFRSIEPTYDSRRDGSRYHVTSRINGKAVAFREPIADPFVRHTVHIGHDDLVAAIEAGEGLAVEVLVGGDNEIVDDVLELDANTLIGDRERRAAFNRSIRDHITEGAYGEAGA